MAIPSDVSANSCPVIDLDKESDQPPQSMTPIPIPGRKVKWAKELKSISVDLEKLLRKCFLAFAVLPDEDKDFETYETTFSTKHKDNFFIQIALRVTIPNKGARPFNVQIQYKSRERLALDDWKPSTSDTAKKAVTEWLVKFGDLIESTGDTR